MTDVIIIGGGVIGLSIARELSCSGKEIILLEKNERAGDVTSSRNSGVIHAGIYYPENFLKTKLCVEGNKLIYEYAQENNGQLFPSGFLVVENVQNLDKQNFLDEQAKHLRPKVTNQELLNSSNMRSSESDGLKVDLLIVDNYSLSLRWEKALRKVAKNIMVIDDLANRKHDCDILLDQNFYINLLHYEPQS